MSVVSDPSTPPSIGAYRVVDTMREGHTFLAQASGGRRVVLKMLESDCLLKGQLHPSIRERLARVRELPERSVANLHGVERDGPYVYMVWDFAPGATLADDDAVRGMSHAQVVEVARELVLAVESLHGSGIVHGALRPGNVIVGDDGAVRLTHVSPLLFSDPRQDERDVVSLLIGVCDRRGEGDTPLGHAADEAKIQSATLRQLSAKLASLDATGRSQGAATPVARRSGKAGDARIRRRSVVAAIVVTASAIVLAAGLAWYGMRSDPSAPVPLDELPAIELSDGWGR